MTRKHFVTLAYELRKAYPEPGQTPTTDLGSDWYAGRVRGWEQSVIAVAQACHYHNAGFNPRRFYEAAGFSRRPDGSMFPVVVR